MTRLPSFYAIADASFGDPVELAKALFEGGARLVQVRNKNANSRELLAQVERIVAMAPAGAQVIVNDRADIALLSGAAGVHLGQSDLPPERVRAILGPGSIIGLSTHNLGQALDGDTQAVDYIAAGPLFPTATKKDADPVLGLDGLREICSCVGKPVVAIGGIRLDRAREVAECGASSIAVISDVLNAPDVAERTREWLLYNVTGQSAENS